MILARTREKHFLRSENYKNTFYLILYSKQTMNKIELSVNIIRANRDNKEPHNWLLNTALKQNTYKIHKRYFFFIIPRDEKHCGPKGLGSKDVNCMLVEGIWSWENSDRRRRWGIEIGFTIFQNHVHNLEPVRRKSHLSTTIITFIYEFQLALQFRELVELITADTVRKTDYTK